MTPAEKSVAINILAKEIRVCRACILHEQRLQAVPGAGNPDAQVFFIGEGPGAEEDRLGEPFVGRAGKFLNEMLASIGWSRADIFIANVVKCRPPGNRDPQPDEAAACWPFLEKQIEIIQPKLIVTLGRHSLARFLPGFTISSAHGQAKRRADGRVIFPLYHPAAALYSPNTRTIHLADFTKIPKVLELLKNKN